MNSQSLKDPDALFEALIKGDRIALSKILTYIESELEDRKKIAHEIIKKCISYEGKSLKIGITGAPGVGKSTFIDTLGYNLTQKKYNVAVLAIDPSSNYSKGSILGDKTRMTQLSSSPLAYIRPSSSMGHLGGVTEHTYNSILVCEAAGFDVIFIETVGVGQSETIIRTFVDFVLLIAIAGAGDDLQGIKKGIMEITDIIVLNKVEKETPEIKQTISLLNSALSVIQHQHNLINTEVFTCSSIENYCIEEIWTYILTQYKQKTKSGEIYKFRNSQKKEILNLFIKNKWIDILVKSDFYQKNVLNKNIDVLYLSNSLEDEANKYIQEFINTRSKI